MLTHDQLNVKVISVHFARHTITSQHSMLFLETVAALSPVREGDKNTLLQ